MGWMFPQSAMPHTHHTSVLPVLWQGNHWWIHRFVGGWHSLHEGRGRWSLYHIWKDLGFLYLKEKKKKKPRDELAECVWSFMSISLRVLHLRKCPLGGKWYSTSAFYHVGFCPEWHSCRSPQLSLRPNLLLLSLSRIIFCCVCAIFSYLF